MKDLAIIFISFILVGAFVGTILGFERIVPEADPNNYVRIENNFNRFYYKTFSIPPSTTTYIYPDVAEVRATTTLVASSNTSGNTIEAVLRGEGTFEIVLGGSYATTTEVSVIGVNRDEVLE